MEGVLRSGGGRWNGVFEVDLVHPSHQLTSLEYTPQVDRFICDLPGRTCRISPFQRKKEKLKAVTFLNCNCILPESPGRRLIEESEFYFLLERAYSVFYVGPLPLAPV
jgi:hypothetical protein